MPHSSGRTYHDPLHGSITLQRNDPVEALLIQLIDTPSFQRLRRIRQLGAASLTFHGAESSRFTHALGVMAIARRAFDALANAHPQLRPYRAVVLCAALLHDIGHGPFSHTCEEIFQFSHEHWTERILQESMPIRRLLDAFAPDLLEQILQVYRKQHPIPLVWQLVSSQLDCDRLDYLMRDSYFTGASYGRLDLERILMALNYDTVTQQLVVAQKGMASIEHYLIVRYFMYAQVYNHPKNLSANWILEHIFRRSQALLLEGRVQADVVVESWLKQDCAQLPLEMYLDADDVVFTYHIHRWQHHEDPVLADLCQRFQERNLLKAIDVSSHAPEQQQELLERTRHAVAASGLFPADQAHYYAGLRTTLSRGYTLYQRGIYLETPQGLKDISLMSPLVATLTQPYQRQWLLYPRDLNAMVIAEP